MLRNLTLFVVLVGALPASAQDVFRVGAAQVDITPAHPIRLNGFGFRRQESQGVYQRVWAKALAIEDETREPALVITLDVLGITDDLRREIARRLEKKTGLRPERLTIAATHTHTAPSGAATCGFRFA